MTQVANKTAVEALRHKNEIQRRINGLLSQLPDAWELTRKGAEVGDARTRLESLIWNNGGSEAAIKPARKAEMNNLKATLEQKQQASKDVHELDQRLRRELAALKEELAALPVSADVADLLAAKGDLAAVDAEIVTLTAALTEQVRLAGSSAGADDLAAKRDELLADAALGKDVKKALTAVEEKLAAAEKQSEKGIDAEQAAIVLERRLVTAREKRAELLEAYKMVMAGFLSEQGAAIEADYNALVAELGNCVTRLFAIDELLNRHASLEHAARFVTGDLRRLKLPSLTGSGLLFVAADVIPSAAAALEVERLNVLTGSVVL
jgi:hypothetical protein